MLADVVRGPQRETMTEEFRRGAQCHKAIDAFTDAHPIVRRSRTRIGSTYRRFSGVLIDVFYDYFLATRWREYSPEPLDTFTGNFYADVRAARIVLPEPAQLMMTRIIRHDLLGQYRQVKGVAQSLRRLSMRLAERWSKDFALDESVAELLANEAEFGADFDEFFPQLRAHVRVLQM